MDKTGSDERRKKQRDIVVEGGERNVRNRNRRNAASVVAPLASLTYGAQQQQPTDMQFVFFFVKRLVVIFFPYHMATKPDVGQN